MFLGNFSISFKSFYFLFSTFNCQQEKIVASCAKELFIVADYTKDSTYLGQQYQKGIPIEVVPLAYVPIQRKIQAICGGVAKLRMAVAKAGPCCTDNGNFILDWMFSIDKDVNWSNVHKQIIEIPGVIETGIFPNMAKKAYFGLADGTIRERSA